jgi:hypothetical protein
MNRKSSCMKWKKVFLMKGQQLALSKPSVLIGQHGECRLWCAHSYIEGSVGHVTKYCLSLSGCSLKLREPVKEISVRAWMRCPVRASKGRQDVMKCQGPHTETSLLSGVRLHTQSPRSRLNISLVVGLGVQRGWWALKGLEFHGAEPFLSNWQPLSCSRNSPTVHTTVFTRARHRTWHWASWIQYKGKVITVLN